MSIPRFWLNFLFRTWQYTNKCCSVFLGTQVWTEAAVEPWQYADIKSIGCSVTAVTDTDRFLDFFLNFLDFRFFFVFLGFLSKLLMLLLKVTKVTTGHQKLPKMGQCSLITSFFAHRAKKASAKGRSPPQERDVGPCSGPYLLVYVKALNCVMLCLLLRKWISCVKYKIKKNKKTYCYQLTHAVVVKTTPQMYKTYIWL